MQTRWTSLVAAVVVAICANLCAAAPEAVEQLGTWQGKSRDNSLKNLAPKTGFIGDAASWEKLCKAWRPDDAVPDVDFSKQIVLVGVVSGPNLVIMQPVMGEKGGVKFVVGGTKIGGPGFGYKLIAISREGVTSVNGNKIDVQSAEQEESITVKVVGTLRTGIVAIGGETTGTTITAQGITWELDFGQVPQLQKELEGLNEKQVVVEGKLERRSGVEVQVRWIVNVSGIQLAE